MTIAIDFEAGQYQVNIIPDYLSRSATTGQIHRQLFQPSFQPQPLVALSCFGLHIFLVDNTCDDWGY